MGTLIWTDDFESYTAGSGIPAPWTNLSNSPVVTAQAHGGTKSVAAGSGGNGSTCYRPLGSNVAQWYADFWMWTNTSGSANQYVAFTPTTGISTNCAAITVDQTGAGIAGLSFGGTTWFTFSVTTAAWHHYLFEVLSDAAGTAKLTVDGTVVGTSSGDTRDGNSHSSFVANVFIQGNTIGPSPPAEFYVDDLSIYSGVVAGAASQARAMVLA